jgi:hypothetical protein
VAENTGCYCSPACVYTAPGRWVPPGLVDSRATFAPAFMSPTPARVETIVCVSYALRRETSTFVSIALRRETSMLVSIALRRETSM